MRKVQVWHSGSFLFELEYYSSRTTSGILSFYDRNDQIILALSGSYAVRYIS